ncbi:Putative calmodulin-like protein 2 [Geodia barretti]|uniref:Calmodulin-like protein 2 n=4 Tax=Geodia barretti TaxID=519541 RepID=A0AA35X8H1_GEOBA|nr:Putative calmodulin-like protein 2 [Geodia barretti]
MATVDELYGPQRTLARDTAKRLLEKDHVRCNFQRGIERQSSHQTFLTETAHSFRGHGAADLVSSLRDRASRSDPGSQNATHLNLGSDMSPRTTVVRSDYTAKPTTKFQQVIPEGVHDIHLADMVPKYMVDKSFGKSLYCSDFNGEKSYGDWSSRAAREGLEVGRRHKTTAYQKSTHFQLGSDPPEVVSETSRCFAGKRPEVVPPTSSLGVEASGSASNVFRSGDYNFPSRTTRGHFLTIQKQDYIPKELASPAGVPTTTEKPYSHVLPKRAAAHGPALRSLRQLLVEENTRSFQNPRDPTSTNVTRAFLNYDRQRTGFITEQSLRGVCRDLGVPISELEISQLMAECDQDRDGKISYVEFTKYLTGQNESEDRRREDLTTTNTRTYSQPQEDEERDKDGHETDIQKYTGAGYQDSTHFQFGNDNAPSSSVYTGDFNMESVRGAKRERAVSPLSAKVMHEFPVISTDSSMATTSRKDFVTHDVTALARQRRDALNTNRSRHEKLAVELSCGKDKISDSHRKSVMSSSYVAPPPGTRREGPVNPAPHDYRHLESDRALLHPPPGPPSSENMTQFGVPLKSEEEARERVREARQERNSRIRDSKLTHIVLGFNSVPKLSEKMAEFGEKEAVDPDLPAAGKPNGPTQGYSVLSHECVSEEGGHESVAEEEDSTSALQGILQQRNFLKNRNPRDPLNINLRKAFLDYDKSLSGSISAEDVLAVCREMKVEITESQLESLLKRCDRNGDGQIDYHEFALHLSRHQEPSGSVARPRHTPSHTSTTRLHFRDPATQKLTAMQRVVMEQDAKRFTPLLPTHFYNAETDNDYLLSTTRKDFKPPAEALTSVT